MLSPLPSRAPSLAARGAAARPGPLGAARRPGGGRCGALGRWRLLRRRRTPHSVGSLSCPRLRATPLCAGSRRVHTLFRPSRLGAALRPWAPPCGPGRRASLALPAPLLSCPPVRPPACCPLRAAPCFGRAFLGPLAGRLPGPSGCARAVAISWSLSRAGSSTTPRLLLPEFRLGRVTWLPAAPPAPDEDAGLHLARLSFPPFVRAALTAAGRHSPVAPAGHAPQSVAIFRCAENTLRARARLCLGGSRAEKEAPRRGGSGTGAPTARAPQDSRPPSPTPPQPAAACAVWGCFQSTPNSIHFNASVHPPTFRVHTPQAESQTPALLLPRHHGRPPPPVPRDSRSLPPKARGLLRVILGSRRQEASPSRLAASLGRFPCPRD